jgi:hypothetical protein
VQNSPDFFLNGQGPLLLTGENKSLTTGFDVKQTRLSFIVTGPQLTGLGNAATKAVIETDFQGLFSAGSAGQSSLLPRLRLAYGELNWGDTFIRMGQDWTLGFVVAPVSLAHIANPATFYAGLNAWREPGVTIAHKTAIGDSSIESALQLSRSDWIGTNYWTPTDNRNQLNIDSGELSGLPAVEARLKWVQDQNIVYIMGHWSQVDGSRINNVPYPGTSASPILPAAAGDGSRNWSVVEGKIGAKYVMAGLTAQGELYIGKNLAPLAGAEVGSFYTAADVHEAGGWLQLGYNFTPEWSIWGVYGTSHCNTNDVAANSASGRYQDTVEGGMIQYRTGPFGVGPEVYHVQTKYLTGAGTAPKASTDPSSSAQDGVADGMQYLLSANFFF